MRILNKILLGLCVLVIGACSQSSLQSSAEKTKEGSSAWMQENGKIKVLSTVRMIDDVVAEIGKDRVDRMTLIYGEIDPHSYELVKGDDEKMDFAQVIFYNGLGLEHGASLSYRMQKHPNAIAVAEAVRHNFPEKILTHGGQVDPHLWMDISLWVKTIDPIVQALTDLSPKDGEMFRANGENLKERMLAVHKEIAASLQAIPQEKRFLVTSHDSFHYFTRAYLNENSGHEEGDWKTRYIAPEGLAPDAQISPADIQAVLAYLVAHRVNTVFSESNISRDALRKIVEASTAKGWPVQIASMNLHSDAMGGKETEAGTYLGMMHHNMRVMVEAWKNPEN